MIFRITVYRHGANPIIMPHGHQAVTGAGTVHVWAEMPARSVVTSELCAVSSGSWQVLCVASVSPSALWCPPCQLDPGGWSTLSLKRVDLGLPCSPSRTGCEKNATRAVKMVIYQSSGSVIVDKTKTLMSQFGSELSFQGLSQILRTRSLSMASPSFGPGNHGRSGEESWGLREALRAQAQFGGFFAHDRISTTPRPVKAQKLIPHPGGTPKCHKDELRKQPGWLDMPYTCQELLGALQSC